LRIYGGDIGDACYAKLHGALADGKYKKLIAFTFVTGRNTPKERVRGSVLVIETTTPQGEKVMLIRANNPQENLLFSVDPEDLVMKTIAVFKGIASARKIPTVVAPLDVATASCSNRDKVAGVYQKNLAKKDKNDVITAEAVELTNEEETNFNGYSSWSLKSVKPGHEGEDNLSRVFKI
jgi:hypothetical protein